MRLASLQGSLGLPLGLDVDQGLDQRVIIEGMEPGWTAARTKGSIEAAGLKHKSKSRQFSEFDGHFLSAKA